MWSGLLALAIILVSFFLFGTLGVLIGQRLERRGHARNADAALFWILGVGGACLVLWLVQAMMASG